MENIPCYRCYSKNYILELKDYPIIEEHLKDDFYEIGNIGCGDYEVILPIVYFKDAYRKFVCHCGLLVDDNGPFVAVSEFGYNNYIKDVNLKMVFAMLLHELGHYKNGDFETCSATEYAKIRNEAVSKGIVTNQELNADRFAAEEIGKAAVINMLNRLIAVRKRRNDIGVNGAINEFQLRIKAVSRL